MKLIVLNILLILNVFSVSAQEYQSEVIREKPKNIEAQKAIYNSGLHASVDLSAFATFGGGSSHKGGFAQDINVSYLSPLTKDGKLWIDAGGYLSNIYYGGDSYRDAGIHAMLNYRFDEHWEAYVYGQLSLASNYNSYYNGYYGYENRYFPNYYGMRGMSMYGDGVGVPGANVIGLGARYHVNKNLSFGVSVQGIWYNNKALDYSHRYDYPLPKD